MLQLHWAHWPFRVSLVMLYVLPSTCYSSSEEHFLLRNVQFAHKSTLPMMHSVMQDPSARLPGCAHRGRSNCWSALFISEDLGS